MPKIKLLPIAISIATGLVFFALGRLIVIQMGTKGIWVVVVLLIVFYSICWVRYQRGKQK